MFFDTLEQKSEQHRDKIKKLSDQLQNLDQEIEEFFKELQVSHEQISSFVNNKDNFDEEDWNELLKQRQEMTDKLQRELNNIRNPIKTKRAYSSLHVERHWIHVR